MHPTAIAKIGRDGWLGSKRPQYVVIPVCALPVMLHAAEPAVEPKGVRPADPPST